MDGTKALGVGILYAMPGWLFSLPDAPTSFRRIPSNLGLLASGSNNPLDNNRDSLLVPKGLPGFVKNQQSHIRTADYAQRLACAYTGVNLNNLNRSFEESLTKPEHATYWKDVRTSTTKYTEA